MKTVLILAGLVALALGEAVTHTHSTKTKPVDATFVERQKKIITLFENVYQINIDSEYYKFGVDYDISANIENYTNKQAVEEFLVLHKTGFLPKYHEFSIFYERMRLEAISIFELFYYAKDFDTFYKTAAYVRVHFNEGQFLYAFYIAVIQRHDTREFVLPAPYEIYPELFTNMYVTNLLYRTKMQEGLLFPELAKQYGIVKENDYYVAYANYSNTLVYNSEEQKLTYLTEDIGWNAFYYYFHSQLPFWWNSNDYGPFKERRGEIYFYYYQQLLARYNLERLTNHLGGIPEFSWWSPVKYGYYPLLSTFYNAFVQRTNNFNIHIEENYEKLRFLDSYEESFLQFLEEGHFKAFDQIIDFSNSSAVNFVGNFWQSNADLYNLKITKGYQRSYEITARQVLGGAPKPFDKYTFLPSALDFYQTSLRDPMFYQIYNRILDYFVQFKRYLKPYTHENLHFVGVKINDVKVDQLVTYFDYYDFDATNGVFFSKDELKSYPHSFKVRQPRLNHKPFSVTINVKSDVETDAVVKIFIGPKYDSKGYPIPLEDNWMKFFELDWFVHKLTPGQNKIERNCDDFFSFKEDSLPITQVWKLLEEGKVPFDMTEERDSLPKRLMLPRGTKDGFPFQFFVFVYPFEGLGKEFEEFKHVILDEKPFGYPFDRPVEQIFFKQPNMFYKEVFVYHEGEQYPYKYNVPGYVAHTNEVPKH